MLNDYILNREPLHVRRALISVFDKTGISEFANALSEKGVEILSTGGTADVLRKQDIPVLDVSDYTKFPEIMDGRIKTINPLIEGGILGLRDKHESDAENNMIKWIDLVICNLYPFFDVVSKDSTNLSLALENIDIGGPTMLRSAAKNVGWAVAVVDVNDYARILHEINENGNISFDTRKDLASKAFGHSAQYDTIVHNYLKSILNLDTERIHTNQQHLILSQAILSIIF